MVLFLKLPEQTGLKSVAQALISHLPRGFHTKTLHTYLLSLYHPSCVQLYFHTLTATINDLYKTKICMLHNTVQTACTFLRNNCPSIVLLSSCNLSFYPPSRNYTRGTRQLAELFFNGVF